MSRITAIIAAAAIVSAIFFAAQALSGKNSNYTGKGVAMNNQSNQTNRIHIIIGAHTFTAVLENNEAAAAFLTQLPLTIPMGDMNGNEKYADLPGGLPAFPSVPGVIGSGDLMLYGSSTIVLFYENFSSSYSYTRLGRIDNPSGLKTALGAGDVTATFKQAETAAKSENGKRIASDGAIMQTADPAMPTRVLRKGTRINMHFGDTIIPGILNDSESAKALIAKLPYRVHMNRYSHDFCGVMKDPLPYSEENVHFGWLNGDIDFAVDANYFTILFEDEENSVQYGHQVNIGVIDCELSKISTLHGSYDVRIELAE